MAVEATMPEAVSVTLAEIAGSLREGLLALAVGTGLQVMGALIDEGVTALADDCVHFADHLCVVAMGIDIDGTKHPLGVVEGDTENTTVVKDLLADLRDRGLDTTRPILCVLDGAKALVSAVKAVFDHPVV